MVATKLPNFFIVGAPKAGTTSLYAYLDQHPQIYMSPLKETHYFCSEVRPENFKDEDRPRLYQNLSALQEYLQGAMREKRFGGLVSSWDDYVALFRNASDEIAIGEATPLYLWSESAPRNIAARFPHARIIINLRNPIDRAYSNYLHMVTAGAIHRSFREQIDANLRCKNKQFGDEWPFLEFGHYHGQLMRYFREFPRSQIHISFYDDLVRTPARMLSDLYAFLGVDREFSTEMSIRHNAPRIMRLAATARLLKRWQVWSTLRSLAPKRLRARIGSLLVRSHDSLVMTPADRAFLSDYYRDEIGKLGVLLNRDLRSWLDPAVSMVQNVQCGRGAASRL